MKWIDEEMIEEKIGEVIKQWLLYINNPRVNVTWKVMGEELTKNIVDAITMTIDNKKDRDMNNDKLRDAVLVLVKALKEDEGYYESWKANIAVAMHDEYYSHSKSNLDGEALHKVFNDGAERFLQLLIR